MSSLTEARKGNKNEWRFTIYNNGSNVVIVARPPRRSPSKEKLQVICDELVHELNDLESATVKRTRIDFLTTLPTYASEDESKHVLGLLARNTLAATSPEPSTPLFPEQQPTRRQRKKLRHQGHRPTLKKRGAPRRRFARA